MTGYYDKLAKIKALWEQYGASKVEVQKQVQAYLLQQITDGNEILRKARHEMRVGVVDYDLPIMVAVYNETYGTQWKVAEIVKNAEIWLLEQSMKGAE